MFNEEENEYSDELLTLIAEYITVNETARFFPQLYFAWYETLNLENRIFVSKLKEKQIILAAKSAIMEQEHIIKEESVIAETLRILNDDSKK